MLKNLVEPHILLSPFFLAAHRTSSYRMFYLNSWSLFFQLFADECDSSTLEPQLTSIETPRSTWTLSTVSIRLNRVVQFPDNYVLLILPACFFFFWSRIKSLVYESLVTSKDLVARLCVTFGRVIDMPDVFSSVRQSMHRRCESCITIGGRSFQPLL